VVWRKIFTADVNDSKLFRAVPTFGCAIQIVRPPLHHLPAFGQALRVIVGSSYFVALIMRQLPFNHVRRKSILIENGAGGAAEPMHGGPRVILPHCNQRLHQLCWLRDVP